MGNGGNVMNTKFDTCDTSIIDSLPMISPHQAALYNGFKKINREEIEKRFAISSINERLRKEKSPFVCNLEDVSLKQYSEELIPVRCLELVNKAMNLGINHFRVCWPAIGEKREFDPIVIGTYLKNGELATWYIPWLEICCWE